MNKYVLKINGMRCGMCEAHVENEIRKSINVKKVKASHIKSELIVITKLELEENDFRNVLDKTGYEIKSYNDEFYSDI